MSGRPLREWRTTLDGEHIGVRTGEPGTTAALAERETFPRRTHERPPNRAAVHGSLANSYGSA